MKEPLFILILFLGWLLSERAIGIFHKFNSTPEKILISQLSGQGCGYQPGCEYDSEHYSGYNIRNPNLHCPMFAASCVIRLRIQSDEIIDALKKAIVSQQDEFDSGDGIIRYRKCIEGVLSSLQSKQWNDPPECAT